MLVSKFNLVGVKKLLLEHTIKYIILILLVRERICHIVMNVSAMRWINCRIFRIVLAELEVMEQHLMVDRVLKDGLGFKQQVLKYTNGLKKLGFKSWSRIWVLRINGTAWNQYIDRTKLVHALSKHFQFQTIVLSLLKCYLFVINILIKHLLFYLMFLLQWYSFAKTYGTHTQFIYNVSFFSLSNHNILINGLDKLWS